MTHLRTERTRARTFTAFTLTVFPHTWNHGAGRRKQLSRGRPAHPPGRLHVRAGPVRTRTQAPHGTHH